MTTTLRGGCHSCGVYVAAMMETNDGALGVVNVNVLDEREPFASQPEPMQYGAETVEGREARRLKVWMRVEIQSETEPEQS